MNTSELMIGDWIYSPRECSNGRVTGLTKNCISFENERNDWFYRESETVNGIPLTKEIIQLNAVQFSLKYDMSEKPFWYEEDKFYCGFFGAYDIEVKYVHEVQNFLRVIGCRNIADNFIIK